MRPANPAKTLCCFLLIMLFASCASKRPPIPAAHIPPAPAKTDNRQLPAAITVNRPDSAIRQQIVGTAIGNVGRPYKWGGKNPGTGFDCSGLVSFSYQKAGIKIPRTTTNLLKQGRFVCKDRILPGDLVFFRNPKAQKDLHVGIFIGDNQFVHAPGKGRTVTISDLDNPYFQSNFIGARIFVR